jgi:hypothetical protein
MSELKLLPDRFSAETSIACKEHGIVSWGLVAVNPGVRIMALTIQDKYLRQVDLIQVNFDLCILMLHM